MASFHYQFTLALPVWRVNSSKACAANDAAFLLCVLLLAAFTFGLVAGVS